MRLLPALLASSIIVASPVAAASMHQFGNLALSPAGDRVASVERDAAPDAPQSVHGRIIVRSAASGAILRSIDPCATCDYDGLVFGPGGKLAFLARQGGTTRLMTAGASGPAATLATIAGIAQTPRFSPDGARIALLATVGAKKEAGATQAGVRQVGEIGETSDEQRLGIVPATGGKLALVSPADRYVYEYDWTPDGRGFVITSAIGNGDNMWWVASLDRLDAASGRVTRIAAPSMQLDFPRVSPDGRTVAFIGGLMSDFGAVGGDVYVVPINGSTPRNLTPNAPMSFTSLEWGRAGLVGSALRGDRMEVIPLDPARGPTAPLWSQPSSINAGDASFARSADGRIIATVAQDFEHGPAVLAGAPGAIRPITHDNDRFVPLVSARSITWRSGGADVQGWLLAPRTAKSAGKAPMITVVHGGPSSAHTPHTAWDGSTADLARAGYYIFMPNPRGSYGQGESFTRANIRDFGGGDLDDILAGIDAAEKVAPIDDRRLGLFGHSYGGFMAMWANTRTNRFRAIVAGAGLSNWISYYGTNGIDQWMIPFFGKSAYDDHDAYWKVSAIRTIRNARTPTFIYVGERDIEVPPSQSIEYWHGLQAVNVPTSLVIYPDEGHSIRSPEHRADLRRRTVAWFDRTLAPR